MTGQTNLRQLLGSMQPMLKPDVYVFSTLKAQPAADLLGQAIGWFREEEGVTLILPEASANANQLTSAYRARLITLHVHSSLEAVGFLAAITARLAAAGISVNPISAFYHDHLFVSDEQAELALSELVQLSEEHRA